MFRAAHLGTLHAFIISPSGPWCHFIKHFAPPTVHFAPPTVHFVPPTVHLKSCPKLSKISFKVLQSYLKVVQDLLE